MKISRRTFLINAAASAATITVLGASPAGEESGSDVSAIDNVLKPDETLVQHARTANQRLLKVFPKGFALDATHHPHISCLQRYVKTEDLDKVFDAVGDVLAGEKPATWRLTAYRYYFIPWKEIGLAGIVIRPTPDLIRFQQKLVKALARFEVKMGTAAAFVTTKDDPDINQPTLDYVEDFVPHETGKKFNPHVTIGIAPQEYLKQMLDEKFDDFTFSLTGAGVYHLGNFGTAREELKSWDFQS